MGETEGGAVDAAQDIEIRSFSGEGQGQRGKRSFAVESGASQTSAGQEVGDWFQAVGRFYVDRRRNANCGKLTRWRQDGERVWNNADFCRERAEEFAIGLNVDFRLRMRIVGGFRVLAEGPASMG